MCYDRRGLLSAAKVRVGKKLGQYVVASKTRKIVIFEGVLDAMD